MKQHITPTGTSEREAMANESSRQKNTPSTHHHDSFNALSWTTDPSLGQDCFSDWVIQVVRNDGGQNDQVYYVHKTALAVGPRHSEYFASLFKQCIAGMIREQHDNRTIFESLSDEEADAMPMLLDFMYGKNESLYPVCQQYNEALMVGSCKLGQYLLVPAMLKSVLEFCRSRLPLDCLLSLTSKLESVVDDIESFHEVTSLAILKFARTIDLDLAAKIHPDLLMRAIQMAAHKNIEFISLFFSDERILASMESHRKDLTKDSFDYLGWAICSSRYPFKGKTAIRLLLLSADIIDEPSSSLDLTRVQKSCVEAITRESSPSERLHQSSFSSFGMNESLPASLSKVLARLPKNVLVAIIENTAKNNLDTIGTLRASLED